MSQSRSPPPQSGRSSNHGIEELSTCTDGKDHQTRKGHSTFSSLNPQEYAERVRDHSETSISNSLYSGQHFDNLARFLWEPYESTHHETFTHSSIERKTRDFAWLYELRPDLPASASILALGSRNGNHHSTSEDNCLLILRGYPSPQWLNELGSQYNIDPEFYHRHLSFLVRGAEKQQNMSFVLPSSQRTIFQMPLISVGTQANADHSNMPTTRANASAKMDTYLHNLRIGHGWECGNSVVRGFTVHDEQLFSVEQKVTVYVSRINKASERWIAVIWFDCGSDLSQSPEGPWFESSRSGFHTYFHPTILFKPNIPFKDHQIPSQRIATAPSRSIARDSVHQSANLLSTCYGRSLHPATISRNPVYALTELFSFVSTSEITLLNVISARLDDTDTDLLDMDPMAISRAQTKLLHYRRVLEAQSHKMSEVLAFIKNRDQLEWPQSQTTKALNALARTEQDFEYLVARNVLLQKRCEGALTTIMNNANILEARSGIALSGRVFKLTLLASTYVPLSFSTSIFGMNFLQFEEEKKGYWVWTLVAVPMLLLSILILLWDSGKIRRGLDKIRPMALER
ncbi:hypothetical protein B0T26DRAFT_693284 [Lasiosphaeria miniovina]|uniref:Uncharacterized protein n=1 Tax=Lasiosphaeria miniovina TaxID=1954250 RepID=A0AA40E3Y7_9PEZI|nr:uncharacterized protein B0T26DRAFT_693284 [Lasiosphaeria miniovina]KAK0727159.1 hypothetical protein B0T26DRAFT_693284 [Lasiosphaeria miniovina]